MATKPTTARVSLAANGDQGNETSGNWGISNDGRLSLFYSLATNLVSSDTNNRGDAFLRDYAAGTTIRVNVSSSGRQANSFTYDGDISGDGTIVAFESDATNLVPADTNFATDVFVHDIGTGKTTRVSVSSAGLEGNRGSGPEGLSRTGRFVAFTSGATNLVSGDTNGVADVFVRDRAAHTTARVSVSSRGDQANDDGLFSSISQNGRYVAFDSTATNLVPGDENNNDDVFVHDDRMGKTVMASIAFDGSQGLGGSFSGSISADGRYVAFTSLASNLVPNDTNGTEDIFVRDLVAHTTTLISVSSDGIQANDASANSYISPDGRYVAFQSIASNLVPDDTNHDVDVFLHDLLTGQTIRVNLSADGAQAEQGGFVGAISANGRYVAFASEDPNLVLGDTNGYQDAFVRGPLT